MSLGDWLVMSPLIIMIILAPFAFIEYLLSDREEREAAQKERRLAREKDKLSLRAVIIWLCFIIITTFILVYIGLHYHITSYR